MSTRKKSTELVFNLKWRYRTSTPNNSAVIGLQDTAVTTISLEAFKSYLLKNSGIASNLTSNDVKMTYLSDDGLLWVLDTEEKFQIALHAFRLKARVEEVIVLKLDLIPGRWDGSKQSSDVETQSETHLMGNAWVEPPDWFINYMTQFKRDLVEEVSHKFTSDLNNVKEIIKEKAPVLISKKHKQDTKRSRKSFVVGETITDMELLRSLKHERKLESKLEKLDAQTKKLREKKQALINKFGTHERSNDASVPVPTRDDEMNTSTVETKLTKDAEMNTATVENKPAKDAEMNASTVKSKPAEIQEVKSMCEARVTVQGERTVAIPLEREFHAHISNINEPGSTYMRNWFIVNSGQRRWADNTQLRMNWGSSEIFFYSTALSVPSLYPGESATITVHYRVPKKRGTYESYWYFYEGDVRFGDALHCCTVVEEPLKPINKTETSIEKEKADCVLSKNKKSMLVLPGMLTKPNRVLPKNEEKILIEPGIVLVEQKPQRVLPKNEEKKLIEPGRVCLRQKVRRGVLKNAKTIFFDPSAVYPREKPRCVLPKNEEKKLIEPGIVFAEQKPQLVLPKNEEKTSIDPRIAFEKKNPQYVWPKNEAEVQVEPVFENEKQPPCRNESVEMTFAEFTREPLSLEIGQSSFSSAISCRSDHRDLLAVTQVQTLPRSLSTSILDFPPNRVEQSSESSASKQDQSVETLDTVMGLSEKMENITIAESANSDSDLDWERVSPTENTNMEKYFPETDDHATNRYGISENELTVELDIESGESDNNSSDESFCEIDSEVSSVSSGYDMLTSPLVADPTTPDFINITIDGSQSRRPTLLSPPLKMEADNLDKSESLKGAPITGDEAGKDAEPKLEDTNKKQEIPDRVESHGQRAGEQPETLGATREEPVPEQCKLASPGCASKSTSERLFIFPQAHSGYEVLPSNTHVSDLAERESQPTQDYPKKCRAYPDGIVNPFEDDPSRPPRSYRELYETLRPYYYPETCFPPSSSYVYDRTESEQSWRRNSRSEEAPSAPPESPRIRNLPGGMPIMLTENLVAGAVNVASSAINTARSVISMIAQPRTEEPSEAARTMNFCDAEVCPKRTWRLSQLHNMGFWDDELNNRLLTRYNFDLEKVANEILELYS